MFEISKTFEFSAAHSVYSQKLNGKWAENTYPKCRRLPGHGHNYRLTVYLKADKLDDSQMVTDFGHLSWLKKFINTCFDHKLIVGMEDPAFEFFFSKLGLLEDERFILPKIEGKVPEVEAYAVDKNNRLMNFKFVGLKLLEIKRFKFMTFHRFTVDSDSVEADFYQRLFDGIALFNTSPTSENFAEFFFYFVSEKINSLGITCSKVSIYETSNSCATYSKP